MLLKNNLTVYTTTFMQNIHCIPRHHLKIMFAFDMTPKQSIRINTKIYLKKEDIKVFGNNVRFPELIILEISDSVHLKSSVSYRDGYCMIDSRLILEAWHGVRVY